MADSIISQELVVTIRKMSYPITEMKRMTKSLGFGIILYNQKVYKVKIKMLDQLKFCIYKCHNPHVLCLNKLNMQEQI